MRSGEAARVGPTQEGQQGFAYLLLLLAVALIGLSAAAAVNLGATMARRDAERQLLAIGAEFEQALRSYAGGPAGALGAAPGARGPRTLEELLKDPRTPGVRRHLRQIYADPLTGSADWGMVLDGEGFLIGIYSRSALRPIQKSGFDPRWAAFEKAETYRDWVFGIVPSRQ
jgi:type II secretory pathway pseudopilin PulG